MKVQAAVAVGPDTDLEIRELEIDEPHSNEVRVRMVASGVCHTDAIVRDQWYPVPLPAVLGHEGAGVVETVGSDVIGLEPGDKVVLGPAFCGACTMCLSGHPMYCADFFARNFAGTRPDGSTSLSDGSETISSHFFGQSSFASHANVAAHGVVKVPADAPLSLLGPLGCGIMTGSGAMLNVLRPTPGSSVAIFGSGAVGMAALLAARAAGASTVIMVDVLDSRLEFATSLGATHTVNSTTTEPVAAVREITGGGAEFALDTTGIPAVFRQMTDSLKTLGHGALVGAAKLGTEATIDVGTRLTSGMTISMVCEGDAVPQEFIPRLIALHEEGSFPFDELIKTYDFSDINRAFADSATGATLKPIIEF
ncbi:aryl-alcohol dehydrogenase [Brevibacterium siliguriense]|uniref:Aryl-alcohol dehydrogenase n=1 Tax=Brevibacterium siliguriense TaxID=1136497 RepID=A0A1H1X0I9_9MICO|nr:NAD(P)-dependent alcohol dehydrogenase [Brevibacterium siliguriense]SDT02712.1 aryl-alcohol dehydrogenase [Brevibacterium siliguriense]